jgi:hypothetical protein
MYIESYYLETKEWKEEFIKALKELDELYPFTKAYELETSKTIQGSFNTLLAPGLSALRYAQQQDYGIYRDSQNQFNQLQSQVQSQQLQTLALQQLLSRGNKHD